MKLQKLLDRFKNRRQISDSGPGFGGSCFKRTLNLFIYADLSLLNEVVDYWEGVLSIITYSKIGS